MHKSKSLRPIPRLFATALVGAAWSCAPTSPPAINAGPSVMPSASLATFNARIRDADTIVIARLVNAELSAGQDRFLLSSTWQVRERLKGSTPASLSVRFPADFRGWKQGPLDAEAVPLHRGQDYVLFLSQAVYAGQANARGGSPLAGATSAGIGYFLLRGDAIQPTNDYDGPRDLVTLRKLIGASS